MRRSRFVKPSETNDTVRTSVRDAFWFDLQSPYSSDERSLADWRVAGLDLMALLLGFTHLLFAVAYVVLSPKREWCLCVDNPLIPAFLSLALDSVAAAALIRLLPSRITPSSLSVCARSASASRAPRAPRCAWCFSR